jgi:hypothetical protein
MSASAVDPPDEVAMSPSVDALSDEVLRQDVFAKLPLFDLLRVRAVCKRWQILAAQSLATFDSHDETKSYCPLVFKRNSLQHLWCGYDCATGAWELLPALTNLPQVDIRPLAGTCTRTSSLQPELPGFSYSVVAMAADLALPILVLVHVQGVGRR